MGVSHFVTKDRDRIFAGESLFGGAIWCGSRDVVYPVLYVVTGIHEPGTVKPGMAKPGCNHDYTFPKRSLVREYRLEKERSGCSQKKTQICVASFMHDS